MKDKLKSVAVIGAGAAGLVATRHLSQDGRFSFCTYEQTSSFGGTWVYTKDVGKDEYGLPVHSSMYKNLKTNLPKEIMELPGFPHKEPTDRSYLTSNEVLKYFERYVQHFDLSKYIKFRHHIKSVKPMPNDTWKVTVIDLKQNLEFTTYYDAVIICAGIYNNPVYPNIRNSETFRGVQMHSHDYREPDQFTDLRALIIGTGPSGLDITFNVAPLAQQVFLSHHNTTIGDIKFPSNVIQKPDVEELTENGVLFKDGSYHEIDIVLYCTGYTYHYPFLSPKCGIRIENGSVNPLYKHMINIEHPTMCFIGIPRNVPGFFMFDLQVRMFIKVIRERVKLPSKSEMIADMNEDIEKRKKRGVQPKYYHMMSKEYAKGYLDAVAKVANVDSVKPVVLEVYFSGLDRAMKDFTNFRNMKYKLLDSESYVVESPTNG